MTDNETPVTYRELESLRSVVTPPRGAAGATPGNEAAEPQLIHIPQQQPAQPRHNQATENYRSQMAKFFQNSEQESNLFDNSRIHGGRQYSEHPYEGMRDYRFV